VIGTSAEPMATDDPCYRAKLIARKPQGLTAPAAKE
jgi:hypothetical protein